MRAVADLDLERFLVDDLDDAERARVARAIDDDPALAAYVAERRASQRAFALAGPRRRPVGDLSPARDRRGWFSVGALVPALAAAAAVVVFATVGDVAGDGTLVPDPTVHARGRALAVAVVVRRGDAVLRPGPGALVRAGDAVRFETTLPAPGRCSVVGADDRGPVVVHEEDAPMPAGVAALPGALVLDDAPGPERFWIACGPRAPGGAALARAWRQAGGPSTAGLADDVASAVVVLEKERAW